MSAQWVPSHVGVEGNEHADRQAPKGAKVSHGCVMKYKELPDILAELRLEEMPDPDTSESDQSGGSQTCESEGEEELWSPLKRPRH